MKRKYTVSGQVSVSCYTIVEAESEEEAMAIAAERGMATLTIHACSDRPEEAFVVTELDGEPHDLEASPS
jgi:hypothetical protein